jgi:valyl-tRNA synthetase
VWYGPNGEIYVGKTAPKGDGWTPELDVLDTWFSSGLWPFSTLGWPEQTPDLKRYYPTTIMETGYDILFFWVARMIMLGLWFTDEAPFKTVYLHGLVRDKLGRKISKTLGNVIDALELVDKYGADPLRFTLVTSGTPGNDINLDADRVERNWRFVNKIWQMANFVTQNLGEDGHNLPSRVPEHDKLDLPSRWILSRLNRLIGTVQRLFETYQYGEAGRQIDDFLWGDFADWYIEVSKHPLYQGTDADKLATRRVLVHVLDTCLRLLHPYMPFVTEEIWSYLPHEGQALIIASWHQPDESYYDDDAEREMALLIDLVRGVRNVRDEYNVEPARKITALAGRGSYDHLIERYSYLFSRLCNVANLRLLGADEPTPAQAASVVAGDITLHLPLADLVDLQAERERLTKEQAKLQEQIARSEGMLGNDQFLARARPDVVERERTKLADLQASVAQLAERLSALGNGVKG